MPKKSTAMCGATLFLVAATCGLTSAQPNYGIDFVTIGAAGNRASSPLESIEWEFRGGVGAVPYNYKIARTEVTVAQYLEFVQAYSPYYVGHPNASTFTGFWIGTGGGGIYSATPGSENFAADMTWHMAARYCNWLHNGKASNREAFERGAYDTSTFSMNADHTWNDQTTHSADARFWIPTVDEWTKAVFYDPNRYGTGEGGYWWQPNGTDTPLIPGRPEDGGQTANGIEGWTPLSYLPIGAYPDVRSPWGLLDASGGLAEATEEWDAGRYGRITKGTWQGPFHYVTQDSIDGWGVQYPHFAGRVGLRIATVPAPGLGLMVVVVSAVSLLRKRNL